jgi:hypothetical protein
MGVSKVNSSKKIAPFKHKKKRPGAREGREGVFSTKNYTGA